MRILMLTTNSSLMDGINRHILTIAGALNRLPDIEVAVCTVLPPGDFPEALERLGVRVFSLGFSNGHNFGIIPAYRRVLNEFRPDIVHIHVLSLMERLVSAFGFRHLKYVITKHGIADAKTKVTLRDRVERLLVRMTPIDILAAFYISKGVKEALLNNNPGVRINEVCYNPVDFDLRTVKESCLRDLIGVSSHTPVIGTACRIATVKNPVAFTEVMCRVLTTVPQSHAVVLGDGQQDLIDRCKAIVEKYKVNNRFHWLGYRPDAPELTKDFTCFVLTSHREGMPTAVLECFAAHTPVAMLEGEGGLQDIIALNTQEKPVVVSAAPNDLEGLASGIIRLIETPQDAETLADNAYEIGRQNFDISSITNQLYNIYSKVLAF